MYETDAHMYKCAPSTCRHAYIYTQTIHTPLAFGYLCVFIQAHTDTMRTYPSLYRYACICVQSFMYLHRDTVCVDTWTVLYELAIEHVHTYMGARWTVLKTKHKAFNTQFESLERMIHTHPSMHTFTLTLATIECSLAYTTQPYLVMIIINWHVCKSTHLFRHSIGSSIIAVTFTYFQLFCSIKCCRQKFIQWLADNTDSLSFFELYAGADRAKINALALFWLCVYAMRQIASSR